jgi:hypothetical protein
VHYRTGLLALLVSLVAPGQIPDFTPPTPLMAAVIKNDNESAKRLLGSGANPNEGRFFGTPPLLLAVMNSNSSAARMMLAHGADPQARDGQGSTALMWAVGNESPDRELIQEFLSLGIDPNAQNHLGETALNWAMRRGHIESVQQLKAAGASDHPVITRSVEKAVALLQKSGPQFVKVSGCISCHHQSLPQMAYGLARERGFHVDPAIAEQQVKTVMAMFKPIREELNAGKVNLPNPAITVSYSLLGLASEGYKPDATTDAMVQAILRTQLPDGSFAIFGVRPPLEVSKFTAAALSIRALQIFGSNPAEHVERTRRWLEQARPSTQEDRAMRLFGLAWAKADATHVRQAASDLLAEQHSDGGWAQTSGLETDAYATGQAMAALHEAGALDANDRSYQKGVAFLLRTQLPDGSWLVRTRSSPFQPLKDSGFPHERHQWISAAGTSWAAMALSLTRPKAVSHVQPSHVWAGNGGARE